MLPQCAGHLSLDDVLHKRTPYGLDAAILLKWKVDVDTVAQEVKTAVEGAGASRPGGLTGSFRWPAGRGSGGATVRAFIVRHTVGGTRLAGGVHLEFSIPLWHRRDGICIIKLAASFSASSKISGNSGVMVSLVVDIHSGRA